MCRRRLFKSNFYINYGGTKKAHGETVIVSPFIAGGGESTFELYSRNPWVITNTLSWLTVSSLSDKSGKYAITITAAENQAYSVRSGSFTVKTLDNRFSIVVSVSQQAKANEKSISISPRSVDMGAKETYSSLICYFTNTGTTTEVVPTWSTNSSAVTVNPNGEIETNNTGDSLTVTVTATYEHEGDVLTDTMTVNVAAAVVTYRNLTVVPASLILGKDDVRNGKTLKAYVDEYVNGVYHERVDVTLTSNWTSANNSIATVTGGSYAVVKPVYGSGFFPDERTTTIIAVYNGSTTYEGTNRATCNITVEPEGYVTHYISVEPTTATIGSTGEVQLTVLYHTVTDGVDDGGVDVTSSAGYTDNGSNLIDVNTTGKVNGSGAETGGNAVVTVSYPGVKSVDVPITVNNASTEEYLEITPASTSTTWNGEVEYSIYYVKKVNGQETNRVKITNPGYVQFTLSDDAAGKMNGFIFEAENISTSDKTVEISAICTGGTYSGIMTKVPAALTVNGADSVDYRLDVEAVPDSIAYSGSSQLYASAVTVVNGSVHKWYVPDDVVWSENSTAITVANGTVTGMHTDTSSTSAVITGSSQSFGKNGTVTITIEGRPAARLTIDGDNTSTVSSAAGQCNYYISWAYLKPGTTIALTTDNLSNFSPTSITITESNYISGNREIVVGQYTENPNTAQRNLSLSGVAQTYYDGTARGYHYYTQEEKETPAVITYELEITPTNPGTKPYSGSQAFVATLYRLTNGTRDGWSEDETEYVDWSISTNGGDFIKSGITTGGTAEWVNLSNSTGRVTVSAWFDEPNYGSPSSNKVAFNVNGVSITSTLTLAPATTTLDYGESVTYTATVTIRHDSTTVFSRTYTFDNWDQDVLSIAPDSNTYLTIDVHDVRSKFDYSNASQQETSVTITCSYRETGAEFLPSGAHIDGTANVTLNEYVEPVGTYSVTFIPRAGGSQTFADYIEYSTTSGSKRGNNSSVRQWTVFGFTNGETIEYTGRKTGYYDVAGSETINGEDLIIYIDFQEIPEIPTIQLMESSSFIPSSPSGASISWGGLTSDGLEINILCNDCKEIRISWESELAFGKFDLKNATDSSGHYYVENDQTFYPDPSGGIVTLRTDVSKQIREGYGGRLTLKGKNSHDDVTTIDIDFAP